MQPQDYVTMWLYSHPLTVVIGIWATIALVVFAACLADDGRPDFYEPWWYDR